MTVTLLYYDNEGTYKGESSYSSNTGITIEQFFKLRSMDPRAYYVTINGERPMNTTRLYDKVMIKAQAVHAY